MRVFKHSTLRMLHLALCVLSAASCYRNEADAIVSPYDYPVAFALKEVPDPMSGSNPLFMEKSFTLPEIGSSFRDPTFLTRLTRVTATDGIRGRHEYSRFDPFNADKSLIVLLSETAEFFIYRTGAMPYNQSANLVLHLGEVREPRWDGTDPNLIWGLDGFEIVRINALSGERETIKDFYEDPWIGTVLAAEPDIYQVTTLEEGESSADKRFWALGLQGSAEEYRLRYLFCWDLWQNRILGFTQLAANESDIDWIGMSTGGGWLLVGGMEYNGGRFRGLTMADRGLTWFHRIDYTTAHADVGLDADGAEVVVMQNVNTDFIDMLPLAPSTQPILEANGSYAGTNRIPLLRLYYADDSPIGLRSGVHVSCNAPGYSLVSTNIAKGEKERNWLDRCQVLVRLDAQKPRVFYLSKIYNTTEEYWEETHGALTADGSRVVWAANWNRNIGDEKVFLLQLDMPANWRTLTGGR